MCEGCSSVKVWQTPECGSGHSDHHPPYFYTLYSSTSGQCGEEGRVQGPPSTLLTFIPSILPPVVSAGRRGGSTGPGTTIHLTYFYSIPSILPPVVVQGGKESPGITIYLPYFYTHYSSTSGKCGEERRVQGPPSTLLLYPLFFHQW